MKCKEIEKYLALYPDDTAAERRDEMKAHIVRCRKCTVTLQKLRAYQSYLQTAPQPQVPAHFEENVLKKIQSKKMIAVKTVYAKLALAASLIAAVTMVFLFILRQVKSPHTIIESHFALNLEKKGKGPSGLVDFRKIDDSMQALIAQSGANVIEKAPNQVTGYYDYMMIHVPRANLADFLAFYNRQSSVPIATPENSAADAYVKIYFDMITFTAGRFDGDNHADLLVRYISGKYKGRWFIYANDPETAFKRKNRVSIGEKTELYVGDYWLLAGDFDGDGFDDLCLYARDPAIGFVKHVFLNNQDHTFRETEGGSRSDARQSGEWVTLIAGDAENDGRDNLISITKIEEEAYRLTLVEDGRCFQDIPLPDLVECSGQILSGDFDGDGYFDLCLKYLKGRRAGDTEVYFNQHDFTFSAPSSWNKSFEGDFYFAAADFDGDGRDDLMVKAGGLFPAGIWTIMRNDRERKFIYESSFQLDMRSDD